MNKMKKVEVLVRLTGAATRVRSPHSQRGLPDSPRENKTTGSHGVGCTHVCQRITPISLIAQSLLPPGVKQNNKSGRPSVGTAFTVLISGEDERD